MRSGQNRIAERDGADVRLVIDLTERRPATRPRSGSRAWAGVVALNVLNCLDAWLTAVALDRGVAIEGNPIALSLGVGGKLALVAVCSALLFKLRPEAIWICVIPFALVVVYSATMLATY